VADKVVNIYADAVAHSDQGSGAWAALLIYGEHRRVEFNYEPKMPLDRLQLLAVVQALEFLTRPVPAIVRVASPYVREGVTASKRTPDHNDDLWERLGQADRTHMLFWEWVEENADDPDPILPEVTELAAVALRKAEADQPTVGSVVAEFLAERKGRGSARALKKYEDVIDTLRWAASWYDDQKLEEIPASELTSQLPNFFEVLIHKQFASVNELKNAKTVLPALLKWFAEHGHLDAAEAASEIEELKEQLDEYVNLRKFVNALQEFADHSGADVDLDECDDHVADEYLRIIEVTDDSISFGEWDSEQPTVGPVAIPAEVAELADTGWEILLSAVQVDGEWLLLDVANGEI
jgi:ribonuclease HI